MTIKPMNGCIFVRVDEPVKQTESGFLLSETISKLPQTGTVEAVADEINGINPGDKVAFLRYAAVDGIEDGTRICKIKHILGVISA